MKRTATIGTIISGTMQPRDVIPALADELSMLILENGIRNASDAHKSLVCDANAITDYDSEDAGYVLEELFDALNELAPSYCYFGAHEGDGSAYGFWPDYESVQMAIHDGDMLCVDENARNQDTIAGDYNGEWVHVNDHGNTTLYVRENGQDTEIWAIV